MKTWLKHIVPAATLLLAFATSVSAEILHERCGTSVNGRHIFDLQRGLNPTRACGGQIIKELGLVVENNYRPGVAHFTVNGIEVGHLDIPAERGVAQRIFLPMPFGIVYDSTLDLRLIVEGRMMISELGLALGADQLPRHAHPETHAPRAIQPDRWATRYNGHWGERVSRMSDRGDNVRDGWDYPNRGMIRDGHTANFQRGNNATLLHAYFPTLPGERVNQLSAKVTASGYGEAEVGLVVAGRTVQTQRIPLDEHLHDLEVKFDGLNISQSALGRIEIWVKNPERQELKVDGISLEVPVPTRSERPSFARYWKGR